MRCNPGERLQEKVECEEYGGGGYAHGMKRDGACYTPRDEPRDDDSGVLDGEHHLPLVRH